MDAQCTLNHILNEDSVSFDNSAYSETPLMGLMDISQFHSRELDRQYEKAQTYLSLE